MNKEKTFSWTYNVPIRVSVLYLLKEVNLEKKVPKSLDEFSLVAELSKSIVMPLTLKKKKKRFIYCEVQPVFQISFLTESG